MRAILVSLPHFDFSEKSDASFSSRLNKCHRSNFVSIGNSREHVS